MGIAKATLRNLETNTSIQVQFNPENYSLTSANDFARAPGKGGPPTVMFTGSESRSLKIKLLVDTTASRTDLRVVIQPLLDLLEKDSKTRKPPRLLFTWGGFQFRCVLQSVDQDYTRFLPSGARRIQNLASGQRSL